MCAWFMNRSLRCHGRTIDFVSGATEEKKLSSIGFSSIFNLRIEFIMSCDGLIKTYFVIQLTLIASDVYVNP